MYSKLILTALLVIGCAANAMEEEPIQDRTSKLNIKPHGLLSNSKLALFTTFVAFAALFSPAAAVEETKSLGLKKDIKLFGLCWNVQGSVELCNNAFADYQMDSPRCLPVEIYGLEVFPYKIKGLDQCFNPFHSEGLTECRNMVAFKDSCETRKKKDMELMEIVKFGRSLTENKNQTLYAIQSYKLMKPSTDPSVIL